MFYFLEKCSNLELVESKLNKTAIFKKSKCLRTQSITDNYDK